jgi:hypothetical protein
MTGVLLCCLDLGGHQAVITACHLSLFNAPETCGAHMSFTMQLLHCCRRAHRVLWYAANLGTSSGATITLGARQKATGGYDDLASFSSFGPTADGRIKPDIVAPGGCLAAQVG